MQSVKIGPLFMAEGYGLEDRTHSEKDVFDLAVRLNMTLRIVARATLQDPVKVPRVLLSARRSKSFTDTQTTRHCKRCS